MKKIISISFLSLAMFLVGCVEQPASQEPSEQAVDQDEPVKEAEVVEEEPISTASYEDWAIPINDDYGWGMAESMKTDCVGMLNGMTNGGDLMSSLIVDDELRGKVDLSLYSKAYVMGLEKKLAHYTQTEHDSDFYAFSVCNLKDGMDLVSGYLWSMGTDPDAYKTGSAKGFDSFNFKEVILLLADGDRVLEVDESVRLLNNTATGAEVLPCDGELNGENIDWTCFLGLAYNDEGMAAGSRIGTWMISIDNGSVLNYEEEDVYMQ
jgi:hypothetical protein